MVQVMKFRTIQNQWLIRFTFIIDEGSKVVKISVLYHSQPTDTTRGDFEDTSIGSGPPETDVNIQEIDISKWIQFL